MTVFRPTLLCSAFTHDTCSDWNPPLPSSSPTVQQPSLAHSVHPLPLRLQPSFLSHRHSGWTIQWPPTSRPVSMLCLFKTSFGQVVLLWEASWQNTEGLYIMPTTSFPIAFDESLWITCGIWPKTWLWHSSSFTIRSSVTFLISSHIMSLTHQGSHQTTHQTLCMVKSV